MIYPFKRYVDLAIDSMRNSLHTCVQTNIAAVKVKEACSFTLLPMVLSELTNCLKDCCNLYIQKKLCTSHLFANNKSQFHIKHCTARESNRAHLTCMMLASATATVSCLESYALIISTVGDPPNWFSHRFFKYCLEASKVPSLMDLA